jgi:predicted enzyme related to lactoylglutathione lyase
MKNMLNWFEIPAADIKRAKKFYETTFAFEMTEARMGEFDMAFFPSDAGKVSGGLCQGRGYEPSTKGALIYLNANPDLSEVLGRIEEAGGSVFMAKTQITPELGYFALFVDSEGNMVALHSNQ